MAETIIHLKIIPAKMEFLLATGKQIKKFSIPNSVFQGSLDVSPKKIDFLEAAYPFIVFVEKAGNIYVHRYDDLGAFHEILNTPSQITFLAINPHPMLMLFGIGMKNGLSITYSLPFKVVYREFPPVGLCQPGQLSFVTLDVYPFMHLIGASSGVVCSLNAADGSYIGHGQITNGFPILGSYLANSRKGLTMSNLGNIAGLLLILDAPSEHLDFTFFIPPITNFKFDEDNLIISANTVVGQTFNLKYQLDITIDVIRATQTKIINVQVVQDENLILILTDLLEVRNLMSPTQVLFEVTAHASPITGGLYVPEESAFFTYSENDSTQNLMSWNIRTNAKSYLNGHTVGVQGIFYNEETKELLSYGKDFKIRVWKNQILLKTHNQHNAEIKSVKID